MRRDAHISIYMDYICKLYDLDFTWTLVLVWELIKYKLAGLAGKYRNVGYPTMQPTMHRANRIV